MPSKPPNQLAAKSKAARAASYKAHDQRRGSAASRGYGHRWRCERADYVRRHPLCVKCLANGISTSTAVVDHIIPHRGDETLMWDQLNWQALCKPHHDRDKQREEQCR
jgi:5-methylcytosine-specific restriction protein A